MGALAEFDAHPQLPFDIDIAGIAGLSGDLAPGINAFDRLVDYGCSFCRHLSNPFTKYVQVSRATKI